MIVINRSNISNNHIKDIKEKSERLQNTNKKIRSFNYTTSHEIKAPIRAIDGYARIFIEDYGMQVDDEGIILIDNIRNICKDALLLINKLLENAKSEDIESARKIISLRQLETIQSIEIDSELMYPASDEKQIINYLIKKEDYAIKLFNKTVENIYSVFSDNIIKADIIIKKMYHNVIKSIYEKYGWMNSYIHIGFFEIIDYGNNKESSNNFMDYCCEKISYLLNFFKKFYLEASDELIKNICDYILNNSDSDLKLKVVAKQFYINNTYLSNTFTIKTGMRFNDYVTMIKMARAKYLFINTQLKTYEVGYKIGYRDINYFSKLFKKYYGKKPSEYRNILENNC